MNRSCPEQSTDYKDKVEELCIKLVDLQNKLSAADNQIDILLLENGQLREQMIKNENKIKQLEHICKDTTGTKRKKKSLNKSKLTSSPLEKINITHAALADEQGNDEDLNQNEEEGRVSGEREDIDSEEEIIHEDSNRSDHTPTKLCVISSNNRNKLIQAIERLNIDNLEYCHYIKSHSGIQELLNGFETKIRNFTKRDFCVILIGEEDFKKSNANTDLISHIKEKLKPITHTNIIVAVPTYVCGAPLYNYKVEVFNCNLSNSLKSLRWVHCFDSNLDLSVNMFSGITGKINKLGINNIFENISINFFRP